MALVGAGEREVQLARREMMALDDESDRDEKDGGGDDMGKASFSDEGSSRELDWGPFWGAWDVFVK